jgi:ABC-type amino acid transport substrate-binding protein
MTTTIAALAAATLTALTLHAAPASAATTTVPDPAKCQSVGTDSSVCHLGSKGRIRVHMVTADTSDEVTALKVSMIDSIKKVQPAVYCGDDVSGYLLELASIHPKETGVKKATRHELARFPIWAEKWIEKNPYPGCVLYGPM